MEMLSPSAHPCLQARASLHVHMAIWVERDEDAYAAAIADGKTDSEANTIAAAKAGYDGAKNICGTAPRGYKMKDLDGDAPPPQGGFADRPELAAWRDFVLNVQRHDCRPKCYKKAGEDVATCKYLYPREIQDDPNRELPHLNAATDRWEYECEMEEDRRGSPPTSHCTQHP